MPTTKNNTLVQESRLSYWDLIMNQFKSPLIYILFMAALVTFLFKEYVDTVFILVAVAINGVLGFYQEYKAENTLQQLKKLIIPKAVLVRDGEKTLVDAVDLRVGDVVELSLEHQIPADGELINAMDISINEAILTGEAMPVNKSVGDPVFAGTTILSGAGLIKITSIGADTKIGAIGASVSSLSETKTPLQLQLSSLARNISLIVLTCALLVVALGIIYDYDLVEISTTAVAVAVASIPEGLVITLTVILAVGMQRISKQKAVVRKLLAAETLGSITTICIDKTGTVTEGKLSVIAEDFISKLYGYQAVLLSESATDPLEVAMRRWVGDSTDPSVIEIRAAKNAPKVVGGIPFNSKNKFTAVVAEQSEGRIMYVYGAAEIVLDASVVDHDDKKQWERLIDKYASDGKKVIGFAFKQLKDEKDIEKKDVEGLIWNGLLTFDDPIRPDIAPVLKDCESAGISVKMITGDYVDTAKSVATEIGLLPRDISKKELEHTVITGAELAKLSDKEFATRVKDIVVFARTDPFQKLKIVNALRENGEVVAMTGDGVNDSPALKSADIGIVVNEASDVSKETADMVLLDSNFKTIVHAVEEGRSIFDNIKKVVMYLLSGSFSEVVLVMGAIFLHIPIPITAVQILWINLIEDSLPALSLAFEPKEGDVLKQPPRKKNSNILDRRMSLMIFAFIVITDGAFFAIYYYFNGLGLEIELIRTIIFVCLGINSLFFIFACKSLRKSVIHYNPFTNRMMVASVVIGFVALIAGVYLPIFNRILDTRPLELSYWVVLVGFGVFNLLAIEGLKWVANRGRNSVV